MMGRDIASGSKITDFEHIFKEPLIFLGIKIQRITINEHESHKRSIIHFNYKVDG